MQRFLVGSQNTSHPRDYPSSGILEQAARTHLRPFCWGFRRLASTPIQPKRLQIVSHLSAELHQSLCAGVEPAHFSTIIRKLEIREHAAKA
jgi:hypothetical protein